MATNPVQIEVASPRHFDRVQLAVRIALAIVLGWFAITFGGLRRGALGSLHRERDTDRRRSRSSPRCADAARRSTDSRIPSTATSCEARDSNRAHEIARFVEKPELEVASQLIADGALWNTFISTGPVATYWELARRFLPEHAVRFEHYATAIGSLGEHSALEYAYRGMTAANFSSDILARATGLAVDAVEGSGWSDWARRVASSKHLRERRTTTDSSDSAAVRVRGLNDTSGCVVGWSS